jgi:hypothetical protein
VALTKNNLLRKELKFLEIHSEKLLEKKTNCLFKNHLEFKRFKTIFKLSLMLPLVEILEQFEIGCVESRKNKWIKMISKEGFLIERYLGISKKKLTCNIIVI